MATQDKWLSVVSTDGGSRGNPGPSAWGFVLESPSHRHTAAGYLGKDTNNVAEYHGVIEALKYALSKGISKLLVRSDSQLIVNHMNGVWTPKKWHMIQLYMEAKNLAEKFNLIKFIHVRREFNQEADAAVNRCLDAARG